MRVLLVGNQFPTKKDKYAGIYARRQLNELRDQNPDDKFDICTAYGHHSGFLNKISNYIWLLFKMFGRCFRKYDVLHVNIPFPTLFFIFPYKICHPTVKIVLMFHGSDINYYPRHILDSILGSMGHYLADHIITVSKDLKKQYLQKIGDTDCISVIPAGVDRKVFYHQDVTVDYDLIYVGSFLGSKGINVLLDALKDVNLRVLFIGRGPMVNRIKNKGYPVKYNLKPEKVAKYMNKSNFLVLPSFNEGTPNVVLEAFSTETPVIGSDIPGIESLVVHKKTGLLFEKGSEYELHEILRGIQSKQIKATDFDKKEMTDIAEKYSLINSVQLMYSIFNRIK